jgi:error-prone DNA polymerase
MRHEVKASIRHELSLIGKLAYALYFLTVHSIVRFARSRRILCQGPGSAANSAISYVLGITAIDPGRSDLLFERFVSEERHETRRCAEQFLPMPVLPKPPRRYGSGV